MTSSNKELDNRSDAGRRKKFTRLVGLIHNSLLQALAEETEEHGTTQAQLAKLLGWNKSFVSRKLNGAANVTLKTIADLAWALDRDINITLPRSAVSRHDYLGSNSKVVVARDNVVPLEAFSKLSNSTITTAVSDKGYVAAVRGDIISPPNFILRAG